MPKASHEYSKKATTYYKLKGYPGLHNMAQYIMPMIPAAHYYVEPFAGLGRTCETDKHRHCILNDLSPVSRAHLRMKFPRALVSGCDFVKCIKYWDSERTFFLIDPPWRKNIYKNNVGPVCDRLPREYYNILLTDILPQVKAKWVLCSDRAQEEIGDALSKSSYENIVLIHPTVKMFGKPCAVRLAISPNFREPWPEQKKTVDVNATAS